MLKAPKEKIDKDLEKLFDLIEVNLNISKQLILSKSRKKEVIFARRIFMIIAFEYLMTVDKKKATQEYVASLVKKDRCSFIYHKKNHDYDYKNYKSNKEYKMNFDFISDKFEKFSKINKTILQN